MMAAPQPSDAEIRTRWDAGNFDGALALALELYAGELFGFINGLARDRTQAEDAFSAACERMWKGLPKFRWESPFRVWAYRIARNEFLRVAKSRARSKTVPLSDVPSIQAAVARARSATPVYERTETKRKLAELRLQLDPEDHMLLGLRIDRKLTWVDIAKVLAQTDAEPTARELAALRKKFERLKTRLREVIRS
jgi:RNA polymerase sigma-70 factor (ECF subfamily)